MKNKILSLGVLCLLMLSLCGCAEADKKTISCEITVTCEEITRHMDALTPEKASLIPEDGILLKQQVAAKEGASAMDILTQALKSEKLAFEAEGAYIKGIGNIYEKDCGEYSGWIYTVNGEYVEVGSDAYFPKEGDVIEWSFVTGFEMS